MFIFRVILLMMLTTTLCNATESLPDFSNFKNIKEKKEKFFLFMKPLAEKANQETLTIRNKIIALQKSVISKEEQIWLEQLAQQYKIKNWDFNSNGIKTLLLHIDIIPTSLLLAQSANESAWGTSRFAKKGNAMFGQWCYIKGCGIVPSQRSSGSHEVKSFETVLESIKSYIFNLNTSNSYKELRSLRAISRSENRKVSGYELASGLSKYSQRGEEYVKEIQNMIKFNNLEIMQ